MRAKRFRVVVAMAALLVVTASCSSDDDGASTTTQTGAGGQTTPSFSGEGSEEFCAFVTDLQKDESLGDLTSQKGYDNFVTALDKLDDAAPDEIQDDVHTIVQWSKKAADVYKANDFDDAKAQGSAEYAALLNDSSIEKATKNLDAYSAQVCGLTGS